MPREKKKNNTFISADAVRSIIWMHIIENHQIHIHKPWMDGQEEKPV